METGFWISNRHLIVAWAASVLLAFKIGHFFGKKSNAGAKP